MNVDDQFDQCHSHRGEDNKCKMFHVVLWGGGGLEGVAPLGGS